MKYFAYFGLPVIRIVFVSMLLLIAFLAYTIYSEDLGTTDFREYEKNVIIYTKSRCNYCDDAKTLMRNLHIDYIDIDISWDKNMQNQLVNSTGQKTVPYIFAKGRFIGGYQELKSLKDKDINALLSFTQ